MFYVHYQLEAVRTLLHSPLNLRWWRYVLWIFLQHFYFEQ